MDDRRARERMVESQIVARGVRNPALLVAMREVPRHLFVPPDRADEAYEDRPVPIGEGQTISQPYIVAAMTDVLAPAASHHLLEIGTGSGYQAAILSRLVRTVISIERRPTLAATALEALTRLGATNVRVIVGDGTQGYAPEAPYDRILVTAGAPVVPSALTDQLADGGRLVIPVGDSAIQRLRIIDRAGSVLHEREGEGCVFVPLIGQYGWPTKR